MTRCRESLEKLTTGNSKMNFQTVHARAPGRACGK